MERQEIREHSQKPVEERILEEILDWVDRGETPPLVELLEKYPEHEAAVRSLVAGSQRYRIAVQQSWTGSYPSLRLRGGDRIDDFEIDQLIAVGGMSEVYRARQLSLGRRQVAIKLLTARAQTERTLKRFEREAMLLAKLHHPNLAEVYGFGTEPDRPYLAMRLVEGRSLGQILESERSGRTLTARQLHEIVGWFAQVADALACVHTAGLVHRDVKPANIVIEDAGGAAVLVDFGLARRVDATTLTETGNSAATPAYAPPEQILAKEVGPRADVFSLGVSMHDLLSGRTPSDREPATLGLQPLGQLCSPADKDLEAVVRRAVEPDPRWRYAHAGDLLEDLSAWLSGRPVSVRRLRVGERCKRWIVTHPVRTFRGLAYAATGLVSVLLVATIGAWVRDAEAAEIELEKGRFLTSHAAGARVPRVLRRLLLGREEQLVAGALEDPGTFPLRRILEEERIGDHEGALFEAAKHIRRNGVADDPLVARFLEGALGNELAWRSDGAISDTLSAAVFLAARVFYERMDVTPEDAEASRGLRAALLRLFLRDPSLPRLDRLYVLTALSGCATVDEIDAILASTLAAEPNSEEQRLGLLCMERVIRRAHRIGGIDRIRFDKLIGSVRPLARRVLARVRVPEEVEPALGCLDSPRAILDLVRAIAFATRQLQNGCDLWDVIPSSWADPFAASSRDARASLQVRAACGDVALIAPLTSAEALQRWHLTNERWGWACAALGDERVLRKARALCEDARNRGLLPPECLDEFDRGVTAGQLARKGEKRARLLDEDSRLGHPQASLPAQRVVFTQTNNSHEEAVWSLADRHAVRSGFATGAALVAGTIENDPGGGNYFRLANFGASEVLFYFEVPETKYFSEWNLYWRDLAADRPYYPFGGNVALQIWLDDVMLDARQIDRGSWVGHTLDIAPNLLAPGNHVIRFRSGRKSTTTYWLREVRLAPPSPGQ